MKRVVFIGNRLNVFKVLPEFDNISLIKVYVQNNSVLQKHLQDHPLPAGVPRRDFKVADKVSVISEIESLDFDVLISNGCPLILPVSRIKKDHQIFINIHPTLLPDLKGKTPLNGVFMTHRKAIGATMHYIDDGIDTGQIIAQEKVSLSPDLDQGLIYKISFDLESVVFRTGFDKLINNNFSYPGVPQEGKGSYFNRTIELQTVRPDKDTTDLTLDKIKSFGIKSQGTHLFLSGKKYIVFSAEKIINNYLLSTYGGVKPGNIVFEYDDKFILRTVDGMIKVTSYTVSQE